MLCRIFSNLSTNVDNLILLFTFTNFQLSGQNIETEAMFLQNSRNWIFDTILEHIMYLFVTLLHWGRLIL